MFCLFSGNANCHTRGERQCDYCTWVDDTNKRRENGLSMQTFRDWLYNIRKPKEE